MTTIGLIRIDLVLKSAGGVTAPELGGPVDLPLSRRRGDHTAGDEIWTPPTSLAGSLRAHAGEQAERWFGSPPPSAGRADERQPLEPSRVRFLGSQTLPPDKAAVRASTAIDPRRGAAHTSTLRSREVTPSGTTVSLFLRLDQPGEADLHDFTRLAATWRPVIGRGRSTGHGQARVTRIAWRTLDLRTASGLRRWLTDGRDRLFPSGDDGWDGMNRPSPAEDAEPGLMLRFDVTGAVHVGSGTATSEQGHIRNTLERDAGVPLLPGTAWKGLLRSRCGYILRSCGRPACLAPAEPTCGACLLCELFGWTGEGEQGRPTGHIGRLVTHDSHFVDAPVARRNHVGIDRFTGGARRAVLFIDEVVTGGTVTLQIDSPTGLSAAERGLLLLAVRDLHDGLIGVGRATTRGYGTLRLTDGSAAVLDELAPTHPTGAAALALLRGEVA